MCHLTKCGISAVVLFVETGFYALDSHSRKTFLYTTTPMRPQAAQCLLQSCGRTFQSRSRFDLPCCLWFCSSGITISLDRLTIGIQQLSKKIEVSSQNSPAPAGLPIRYQPALEEESRPGVIQRQSPTPAGPAGLSMAMPGT